MLACGGGAQQQRRTSTDVQMVQKQIEACMQLYLSKRVSLMCARAHGRSRGCLQARMLARAWGHARIYFHHGPRPPPVAHRTRCRPCMSRAMCRPRSRSWCGRSWRSKTLTSSRPTTSGACTQVQANMRARHALALALAG